jgi:hypothetical protein
MSVIISSNRYNGTDYMNEEVFSSLEVGVKICVYIRVYKLRTRKQTIRSGVFI